MTPAARGGCVLLMSLAIGSPAAAQTTVQSSTPTLAELLKNLYGPNGLVVDSEAVLPDGSTHSAHFNGGFQSEFGDMNIGLVRQLVALPLPSPASGFTYSFDSSTGTFQRSTQSFGPILADRAETIGRGKFSFGYSLQQFVFRTFDGVDLSHIHATFSHDDFQLGGGRADVITAENAIAVSVLQSTASLTYGVTDRLDLSLAVPLVRTSLNVISDATIHRIGTGDNLAIHFFRDSDAPGGLGSQRRFLASGSAGGLGDVIVRAKANPYRSEHGGLAIGVEARLPTGNEQNLLGSGSVGLKAFGAASIAYRHFSPHVNVGYEWNSDSVLAGNVTGGIKGHVPAEIIYIGGADVGVTPRLTVAFDVIGRHSPDSPRLTTTTFRSSGPTAQAFPDIHFTSGALDIVNGAVGTKLNIASTVLVTFNLQFNLNDAGLRTKVTPLLGLEYVF
jgi:Putative MetA-pathway of phenol degradation